jgi:hypothetical protein
MKEFNSHPTTYYTADLGHKYGFGDLIRDAVCLKSPDEFKEKLTNYLAFTNSKLGATAFGLFVLWHQECSDNEE